MLHIVFKVTLKFDPTITDKFQVLVIELSIEHSYMLIVKNTITVKLILPPFSFIGYFMALVIEDPSPLHLIFEPFSTVFASLLVVKSAESMAIFSKFVTFIASLFELLSDINWDFLSILRDSRIFFEGEVVIRRKYLEFIVFVQ